MYILWELLNFNKLSYLVQIINIHGTTKIIWTISLCAYVQFVLVYCGSLSSGARSAGSAGASLMETRLRALSLDRMASLYAKCFA